MTEYAAQLVKPSPKAHYLGASAGNCRKSLARRCRVPLVDKGCQGKSTDHPPARRVRFKRDQDRIKETFIETLSNQSKSSGQTLIGWRSNVNQVVKSGGEHIEVAKTAKQDRAQFTGMWKDAYLQDRRLSSSVPNCTSPLTCEQTVPRHKPCAPVPRPKPVPNELYLATNRVPSVPSPQTYQKRTDHETTVCFHLPELTRNERHDTKQTVCLIRLPPTYQNEAETDNTSIRRVRFDSIWPRTLDAYPSNHRVSELRVDTAGLHWRHAQAGPPDRGRGVSASRSRQ